MIKNYLTYLNEDKLSSRDIYKEPSYDFSDIYNKKWQELTDSIIDSM